MEFTSKLSEISLQLQNYLSRLTLKSPKRSLPTDTITKIAHPIAHPMGLYVPEMY